MGWDSRYLDAEQQRAAEESRARMRMSDFERMLLDQNAGLALVLERIADTLAARQPASPVCPDCGSEQPIYPRLMPIELDDVDVMSAVAALTDAFPMYDAADHWPAIVRIAAEAINGTRSAAGDGGGASAEPPETLPGSARPTSP